MKFFIDEDVDADVGRVLRRAGHDAWITTEAGRSGASDTDQVLYAHDHGAVLVTHDRELVTSRSAMPVGRVVRLKCPEIQAPDVLEEALPLVVPILEHNPDIFLTVSRRANGSINLTAAHGTEHRRRK